MMPLGTVPALAMAALLGIAGQVAAETDETYARVGWLSDQTADTCRLYSAVPKPRSLTEFLQNEHNPPPPFAQVIARGQEYEFIISAVARDRLEYRLWAVGGYTDVFTDKDGREFILTPVLSETSSPYLSAVSFPEKRIWTDHFEFDEQRLIFTATATVRRSIGFKFLIDRAEAGFLYVIIPSDVAEDTVWEVRSGPSFRDALAAFIECQESISG